MQRYVFSNSKFKQQIIYQNKANFMNKNNFMKIYKIQLNFFLKLIRISNFLKK